MSSPERRPSADKEVTQQQAAVEEPFRLHFSLSVGGESEFVFRGVDILPEVNINAFKALNEATNAAPGFRQFLANSSPTYSSRRVQASLLGDRAFIPAHLHQHGTLCTGFGALR